jgi:hypothetical protein
MIDLKTMTIEDLRALKDEVSETLKAKRADAKASASETKDELDKLMRAELTEGSKVIFKFGKDEVEGTVKRLSEKSVTVTFIKDGEETKRYRKYSEILKIVEKAAKAA